MLSRREWLAAMAASPLAAAEYPQHPRDVTKPFEAAAFKAAQEAGKPLLVDVFAPWCPTCKAQHKVLESLAAKPEYAGVTVFQVDYDNQAGVVKAFSANQQSTLIAFKGAKETGRSVGSTKAEAIEALLASTLE